MFARIGGSFIRVHTIVGLPPSSNQNTGGQEYGDDQPIDFGMSDRRECDSKFTSLRD